MSALDARVAPDRNTQMLAAEAEAQILAEAGSRRKGRAQLVTYTTQQVGGRHYSTKAAAFDGEDIVPGIIVEVFSDPVDKLSVPLRADADAPRRRMQRVFDDTEAPD